MESENQPTFFRQLKAMLKRNIIMKKREKRKTLAELLLPMYFLLFLVIIKLLLPNPIYGPIMEPQGEAQLFSDLVFVWEKPIHVAPDSESVQNFTKEILITWKNIAPMGKPLNFIFHSTEEDLLDLYTRNQTEVNLAVIFGDDPLTSMNYTMRNNPQTRPLPSSNSLWADGSSCRTKGNWSKKFPFEIGYTCPANHYYYSNLLALQSVIENTWLRLKTPDNFMFFDINLQIFPKPNYVDDVSLTVMRALVPFYMVMVLSQFITYLLMLVVGEKEKKIKEGLAMMGLRDSVYWLSWFLIYVCFVLLVSSVSTAVLFAVGVFINTNAFLIFIILFLYGISVISLAFVLTAFFDKARVAGVFGGMAIFFVNLLYYVQVMASGTDVVVFWLISLLSPTAFALAMDKAVVLDITGEGLTWSTLWNGPDMPFAGALIMIVVDIVLYGLLAFYFDSVIPSEFGAKRPPWFCLMPSYWCRPKANKSFSGYENAGAVIDEQGNDDLEPVPRNLLGKEALRIRNIFKTFRQLRKPEVKAVQGITLDVYEGQITAILGHNGAGKTTLFNMLTGMLYPTKGTASLYGLDIRNSNDMSEIRRFTGVCPQHDVLFDSLTPKEHLEFFADMRGVPKSKIPGQVQQTLEDLVLTSKAGSPSGKLSGGQKRKLSIGIALIGDPKIIFLDEPTAGVDPYSRRHLWSLLQKRKEGKVILLTTHFMDEADLLADRKAIVSHGELRCCGSSLFLKNKFGIGYHLTFVMKQDSKIRDINTMVVNHVQGAQITRHYGKELSFILPREDVANFPPLFAALEDGLNEETGNDKLGFMSYGISMTTLEEVFLKLGEEEEAAELKKQEGSKGTDYKSKYEKDTKAEPICPADAVHINAEDIQPSKSQTFNAMIRLRILNMMREPQAVFFQLFMPIIFAALGIYLATLQTVVTVDGSLNLNLTSSYGHQLPLLYNSPDSHQNFIDTFSDITQSEMESYSGNFTEIFQLAPKEAALDMTENTSTMLLRYNDTYQHLPPMLLNAIYNTFLRMKAPDTPPIQTTVYPLPNGSPPSQFDAGQFTSAIFIGMVFIFAPTGLVLEMVQDRETMCRNQLRVNGLTFGLYFGSFFVIMGSMMVLMTLMVLGLIAAFQLKALTIPAAFGVVTLLYFLYCPTGLLMASCVSYFFNKMETAQSVFPNLASFLGFLPYVITMICDMLQVGGSTQVATILHCVFCFTDTFYIPFAIMYYVNRVYIKCWLNLSLDAITGVIDDAATCDNLQFSDYMTTEITVIIAAIIVQMPIYFLLLMIIDIKKGGGLAADAFPCFTKRGRKVETSPEDQQTLLGDSDVLEERDRVQKLARDSDTNSAVLNLAKVYEKGPEEQTSGMCQKGDTKKEKFVAVKSLSLAVSPGEVFGLLGHNGAGKTTTLRMIIAEESTTAGKIQVSGIDIKSNLSEAFQALGYCPQHDAVWKNLSIKEHLEIFSSIRGIPPSVIPRLVGAYLEGLQIEEHADKLAKNCSGGTKRKLSYAASMLGRPAIVLLDEPSTGMDPQSKRFLWDTISASFKGQRGAILTTHSMEEADALCARVGIMVKGELRCLGSSQHLKNRYGSGYVLEVKLKAMTGFHESNDETVRRDKLQRFVKKLFSASEIRESFEDRLIFEVPQRDMLSLADTFAALEQAKTSLDIEEYSFSQTTLEQVFLKFAQLQEDPDQVDDEESERL